MKNEENELEKDDIVNPEQFQVGRATAEDKEELTDDAGYTPEEDQFADGKGTQLAEEFETDETEELESDMPEDLDEQEDDAS